MLCDRVMCFVSIFQIDMILVAPASADLIAKASLGISDNLVLSIMRAWNYSKPCLVCPAMNTMMWEHPATQNSLQVLTRWGWKVVHPMTKVLACKEEGQGALAAVSTICQAVREAAIRLEVPAAKTPTHPYLQMKSTALSRRYRNAHIKYSLDIVRYILVGFVGVTIVHGVYVVGKRVLETYSVDV